MDKSEAKERCAQALDRAARWNQTEAEIIECDTGGGAIDKRFAGMAERYRSDAALLRALAKALRDGPLAEFQDRMSQISWMLMRRWRQAQKTIPSTRKQRSSTISSRKRAKNGNG